MSDKNVGNSEPGAGAPRLNVAPGTGNLESGIMNLEASGTTAARPAAPLSEAKPSATDPFFSGRRHFPELDGLRGLAILMVLLFHYATLLPSFVLPVFGQGWAGVQLFFVLSGFLITGILLDSKGQEHYFRNFYARRTLRIFPLYYGVLSVLLIALLVFRLGFPQVWAHKHLAPLLWSYQPWLWTYTANIQMAIHNKVMFLVGHFWTLCVEEQFYLVWPLVVFAFSRKTVLRICVALIAGALVIRLTLTGLGAGGGTNFVLTPCQMDSLAAGALVATLIRLRGGTVQLRRWAVVAFAISTPVWLVLAIVIPALWRISRAASHWTSDFLYSVLAAVFASLIVLVVTPGTGWWGNLPKKLLNGKFPRWVGRYSYGIYVYHFPIMIASGIFLQDRHLWSRMRASPLLGIGFVLANIGVSVAVAYASYHLYEKHFLKLKKYFPEKAPAAASAVPCGS